MSQITTHILDTSLGKPAQEIKVILEKEIANNNWEKVSEGLTNKDGRLPGLVAENIILELGIYKLTFDTLSYFQKMNIEGLYPSVSISFIIKDNSHYHIPLLLNPFGYSTYRGS